MVILGTLGTPKWPFWPFGRVLGPPNTPIGVFLGVQDHPATLYWAVVPTLSKKQQGNDRLAQVRKTGSSRACMNLQIRVNWWRRENEEALGSASEVWNEVEITLLEMNRDFFWKEEGF